MARRTIIQRVAKHINSYKIKKALIEGHFLQSTRHKVIWLIYKIFCRIEEKIDLAIGNFTRRIILKKIPIQNNLIVFCSFQGDYTDNPKYIAEELIRRNVDCELIWIARRDSAERPYLFPDQFSHVYEWWSWDAFIALARAKVLIVNSVELFKRPYPKKNGQYIIETWHGSLGIKRFDKKVNSGKAWVRAAELTTKICDYLVSNSTFETEIYRSTFWPKQEVWEVGHPRNDCIVNCTEKQKIEARERLFAFLGKKDQGECLFLYAPTFRDSKNFDCYDLRPEKISRALEERFGGKWMGMYRYHPTVREFAISKSRTANNVLDLTEYPDMQDLLMAADIGITDYSSWIFDFMLTKRPAFIFATDMSLYNTERGFAYPLQTTPFPIAENNAEMVENILNFKYDQYDINREQFLKDKGCFEIGHASELVVDKILELMENG